MSTSAAGPRVLYSGFHYLHHNPGSGYDAVVPDPGHYVSGARLPYADRLESTKPRHLNFLLLDLLTILRGMRHDTVHYFYPESTAYLSPWVLRLLGKRIVYTVHLADDQWLGPTRSVHHRIKQVSLRAAHAIVVLSSQQRGVFAEAFPDKVVTFVPHGFTFSEAVPPVELFESRTRGQRRLVLVGTNYRDFDMLESILAQRGSRDVHVDLVGMDDEARNRFANTAGVVCHPRLDAESYGDLLRTSFALVLPLTFATANNALFEAYSAYLPAFVSRIDGVTDYAADGDRSLFSSPEEFWSKYDALAALGPRELRDHCVALHEAARDRFSWSGVRAELAGVYASSR
ncbi:glycosyltransferase involved in cell wall biosynthesis [Mycolicibacterium iranicum]|uniref:Glycosyltransferase involved in cell wall biosynthesis n=1 Tax=Mycolicibacterium iranicum TaxID=912594 RepID=A0A839Q8Q9_MYCIR|nr:glycosyltransferase family 4 protein [Mycolicibacterium iranicum]MBB2992027.1 glycosyltransferase involved in cell wall biosynthesis [Mycolicibacterium iranicum]